MKQQPNNNQPDHHYYVCCAFGWKTHVNLEEAIVGLVRMFETDTKDVIKGTQKSGTPGMYIWTARVHAEPGYDINFYQPQDVEMSEVQEYMVTKVTKSHIDLILGNPVTRRIAR